MTQTSAIDTAPAAPMGLVARFIGILTAPKATFQSVVANPKWLGMLAVTSLIVAMGVTAPLLTEGGRQSLLDQQVQMMERFGVEINDAAYTQMRQRLQYAAPQQFISTLVGIPIVVVVLSGILFGVFLISGAQASFKQTFSVCAHAGVIFAASLLFVGPLNYFRESMSGATNLAVLLPMISDQSFLGRLLGMIDVFWIWWLVVLSIGLGVLYKRRTQSIALILFGVYGVGILLIATVMGMFGRG